VRKHPRYIDPEICTACGDCADVCPIVLPDEYDQGLSERKAIFKKYAQAIPGAFAITKTGIAPCKAECPAHISVQGYVALTAQGKFREALQLIKEENPLPAICGRVCHHPCESVCTRGNLDEPLAIDFIKRFVADLDLTSEAPMVPVMNKKKDKRVAIVGAGPAGLSCAYYLAKDGYDATVFERLPVAGGMLTVGIPAYRLPRRIIEAEIQVIREMGVDIRTGVDVGKDITIDQIRDDGYSAVFLGIGAQECKALGIEGENLEGVYPGVDFLRDVNLGNIPALGSRIAVIGGGNVAMDAVRTACRLGAKEAFILYRRGRDEMPANEEEIEECLDEGIEIRTLVTPTRIIGEQGRVKAVECIHMTLGVTDESGRRRPMPLAGSEFTIPVDGVIPAIGQESDWSCLGPDCACTLSDWGTVNVDPLTFQTDDPYIFAGGDAVTGPKTVIEAIEAGKQAAVSIDRFLQGSDLRDGRENRGRVVQDVDTQGFERIPRTRMTRLDPKERILGFREVQLGFTEAQAVAEAKRCLSCGVCAECYQCVDVCGAKAVTLDTHRECTESIEIEAGAVILAPGFQPFSPSKYGPYAYARHPNVITSMEFERILSASGPTMGRLVRPSDKSEPEKIAWIQCVGSRDIRHFGHGYCSSVCCMYAIKEAVIAKEHAKTSLDCAIFFMDMRTHGKDFEQYFNDAKEKHGVRFIRSRVPTVEALEGSDRLVVPYSNEQGEIVEETFDMVILSVGLEVSQESLALADIFQIELTEGHFSKTTTFNPASTSKKGVFTCGAFHGPMDIPQSVVEAGSAAARAGALLSESRYTQVSEKDMVPERDIEGVPPRIGVFLCQCGINISGVVDIDAVRDYAANLPYVVYVTDNLYTCSQDTQETMAQMIEDHDLNRIVVAACTPKTHEALFQETLASAGLNKYLFEMANIRNQDSWVHRNDSQLATEKAKDLVRMAVSKTALTEPLREAELAITPKALVIGGGIAGMAAAENLSEQGYPVCLIERDSRLGGTARRLFKTWKGENIGKAVDALIHRISTDPKIEVLPETEIAQVDGFVGNFKTRVTKRGQEHVIEHGVAVVATGASESRPEEYLYGQDPRIVTHLELVEKVLGNEPFLKNMKTAVFIQCVGSREPQRLWCSRVCCTHAVESAIHLKGINPGAQIYILYRDIRTFGERESLYREARKAGIVFIRFSVDKKPKVSAHRDSLSIEVFDAIIGEQVTIRSDLLALASAIIPHHNEELAQFFKVPLNQDGFFQEAHAKLGPSQFATDGIFLCGMAHYPKTIDESVAQALAASSRAVTLLAGKKIHVSGMVAFVDHRFCSGCGVCIEVCPYGAPSFPQKALMADRAEINPALCKGCGLCVSSCRSGAINLKGFGEEQIMAMINEV
jgi:heterodisulfide reductase subunit A-like polyferredoxin